MPRCLNWAIARSPGCGAWRVRVRPRVVKRVIFEYNAEGDVDRTGCKATISTDILAGIGP
ncbi:hypothetical protein [Nocardiopsis alborubida]|uniref:hypothetical protein n=1 Tax=Nocardiopsis alborubida TaxID=146802 RepID=UPI00076E3FAD|nr:hypothetical protein [Nocardiopsis alborubida]